MYVVIHGWNVLITIYMSIDLESDNFNNKFYDVYCNGYPRNREYFELHLYFGQDVGMDFQVFVNGLSSEMCDQEIGDPSDGYSST